MNLENNKIYENKTWNYLLPCLRYYGDSFVTKFNPIYKVAVGIYDDLLSGTNLIKDRSIFILCDNASGLYTNNIEIFLDYIKQKEIYIMDYCPDADIVESKRRMIVLKIPKICNNTYDRFIEGKYSLMYSKEEIDTLFSNPKRITEYKIITKDKSYEKDFFNKINKEFDLNITSPTFFNEEIKEYELPLINSEEIFNNNNNTYINQIIFKNFNKNERTV